MKNHLSPYQIKFIKNSARSGKSLNYISQELSIPKTTAYWWFRKSVGKKIKPIIVNEKNPGLLGELSGAFSGDGNFFKSNTYQYRISYFVGPKEKPYSIKLKKKIFDAFGRKANIYYNKKYHVFYVVVYGRDIYKFLKENLEWGKNKTFSVKLRKEMTDYDENFLMGFARGIFDTDGSVNTKGELSVAVISNKLITQTSEILNIFGISHKLFYYQSKPPRKPLYGIRIGKKDAFIFLDKIGLSNDYKARKILMHQ